MKSQFFLFFLSIFLITGCVNQSQTVMKQTKPKPIPVKVAVEKELNDSNLYDYSSNSLNDVIIEIAKQLFKSNTIKSKKTKIILTSFVDLDNLEKTTTFGRMLSESMFNELHVNKFNVTDFRGQDAISVTKDGEFHITRDTGKLKDNINAIEHILVGTYVKFENKSFLINSRIIDSVSGNIISSSRVIYKPEDCKLYSLCEKKILKKEKVVNLKPIVSKEKPHKATNNTIMIIEDK